MTDVETTQAPQRDARWTALIVLCAGFMMIILDSTIVNVALPSIQADLGFTQSSLAWVVNAGACSCSVSRCSRFLRSSAGWPRARRC